MTENRKTSPKKQTQNVEIPVDPAAFSYVARLLIATVDRNIADVAGRAAAAAASGSTPAKYLATLKDLRKGMVRQAERDVREGRCFHDPVRTIH